MADNNFTVNYEDERFAQVGSDKQQALTELEQTYGGMIGESDKYYQAQIDASKQWADTQSQLQQDRTDFTIEQIEQQKDQAHKDYVKEQSGAYVDWQKQSNQFGTEAERMASAGMLGTGFSESSQVSMYNTYQNRVATARESYNQAVLNYNNAITEARLQNNSVLAEIAYQSLQQQLELSLQGFQYKNQLILDQANKKIELDNTYYNRYLDVLNQINTENAMAEDQRQFNESMAMQQKQFEEEVRQYNQTYQMQKEQMAEEIRQFNLSYNQKVKEYEEGIRQFNEEIARLKKKDQQEYELEIKNLELKKKQLAEEKRQFEESQKIKREQLAQEQKQFEASHKLQQDKFNAEQRSAAKGVGYSITGGIGNVVGNAVNTKKDTSVVGTSAFNKSVANLGRGPLNANQLAELVAGGYVKVNKDGTVSNTGKVQSKTLQLMQKLDPYTQKSAAATQSGSPNKYSALAPKWELPNTKGGGGGGF
jgi:hypothetical protein